MKHTQPAQNVWNGTRSSRRFRRLRIAGQLMVSLALLSGSALVSARAQEATVIELTGEVRFTAPVSVEAFTIHGKAPDVKGTMILAKTADGFEIHQVSVKVPVTSLTTGMSVRDEHMRERIFQTASSDLPDLSFESERAPCTPTVEGASCQVTGQLSIQGKSHPLTVKIQGKQDGTGYQAKAEATVLLSNYGITPPSQFGVTTSDEVLLEITLQGRPTKGVDHVVSVP